MNRRRIAERAILLAGGTVGVSLNYDPNGFGKLVTEGRWAWKGYSACQDLASRLALEACNMKQKMLWCNREDGGNKWIPGMNLIRIKQNASYAWKNYNSKSPWDIRLGDAVEILNSFGPHTFLITEISYGQDGNPSSVDTADYGQFHSAGGKPAAASARCYPRRPVKRDAQGYWTINGHRIIGRLDIMAIREKETGLAETDSDASPAPLPDPFPSPPVQRKLEKGCKGADVEEWQRLLERDGYDLTPYHADGDFGNLTKLRTGEWQHDRGLDDDGVVGKLTRAQIDHFPVSRWVKKADLLKSAWKRILPVLPLPVFNGMCLGLSVPQHETRCGESWSGLNWGAVQKRLLTDEEKKALERLFPSKANLPEAIEILNALHPPAADEELHVDYNPDTNLYYWIYFWAFKTEQEAADMYVKVIGRKMLSCRDVLLKLDPTPRELSEAMYKEGYYKGFHDPTTEKGKEANIVDYERSLSFWLPRIRKGLIGWSP